MIARKVPSTYQHRHQPAGRFSGHLPLIAEYVVSLLILIGIGALLLWGLNRERDFVLADRHQTQTTLAQVAEAELVSTLRASSDVLEELADMSQEGILRNPIQRKRIWQNEKKVLPEAALLFIANEKGVITYASRQDLVGKSIIGGEFFEQPRLFRNSGNLFVSSPELLFEQRAAIILSKPIMNATGQFRGISALTVPDANLEHILISFRIKPSQTITLLHESGAIIARNPPLQSYSNAKLLEQHSIFQKHLTTHKPLSFHLAKSAVDGESKVATVLTINTGSIRLNRTLTVSVMENADAVLAPWRRMAHLLWAYLLLVMIAVWYGASSYRRRRDNENARSFIDSLLSNPELMVIGLRKDGSIALFNTAASSITGYASQDVLGRDCIDLLVPPCSRAQARTDFFRIFSNPVQASPFETPVHTASGEERILSWRHAIIKDRRKPLIILIGADVTLERKRTDELQTLAQIDALTEVANRRHFLSMGNKAISQARRHRYPLAVMMFDIDHFKRVNDTYGHHVGDKVLRIFAQICRQNLREEDMLGRLGGEEFAVILPHADLNSACTNAHRIRENFAAFIVELGGDIRFSCTVSIGITEPADDAITLEALLKQADTALYEAKKTGRNRVVTYREAEKNLPEPPASDSP